MNRERDTPGAGDAEPTAVLSDVVEALTRPGHVHPDHAAHLAEYLRHVMSATSRPGGVTASDDTRPPAEGYPGD